MPGKVDLSLVLDAIDQASPTLRAVADTMGEVIHVGNKKTTLGEQLQEVAHQARNAVGEIAALGAKLGIIGGVALVGFKNAFLDIGAEFQRMETVLTTLEGSPERAKESLQWIQEFATRTPYEINEVIESFVRLRSYGIDPTNGTLATLGDAAAAMGKPMMDAVEMIADAVNGENERLKEFGIKASTNAKAGTIAYTYFNRQGQEMVRVIRNNRTEIRQALTEIFAGKYAGGMEALSQTWNGMIANLKDAWTNFAAAVMDSGVMEALQTELGGLLDWVNTSFKGEEGKQRAKEVADIIIQKIRETKAILETVWPTIVKIVDIANQFANALGGWGNVINIGIILMSLGAIGAIVQLVFSLLAPILTIAALIGGLSAMIGIIFFVITAIGVGISPITAIIAVIGGHILAFIGNLASIWQTIVFVAGWVGRILLFILRFMGPIGLIITLMTTIVGLGVLLYQKWQPFRDLVDSIVRMLKDIAKIGWEKLSGLAKAAGGALGFRAEGGPVSAGSPYIVGERGPELFVPGQSGSIVPNNLLANMATVNQGSAAGGSQTLHIKFDVVDRSLQLLSTASIGKPLATQLDMGYLRT